MVYRGLDEALEREVAVKTLMLEGSVDEESRKRFEIEAKAAAKLQHPNIVTVFELGEDRGVPFIAMELLPGVDLETLMRSGEAVPLAEKLDVAVQVCRGLAFAHEHRVIHRDVKPSNVRLLDDGSVKIMDFGIAKLGSTNVTRSGMMVGTLNYMSPEQIRGQALDGRCDVFSVGVILFQMLAGRRPFVGKGGTDVLYKIVQEPTPPLGVDLGPVTPRLEAIVAKALEKDPQNRYASASDLAHDLEQVIHSLGGLGPLPPADQRTVSAAWRALKQGRTGEAKDQVEPLVARFPDAIEPRRLLRAVRRDEQRRAQPAGADEVFPELEATYRASVTQRSPGPFPGGPPAAGAGTPAAGPAAPARPKPVAAAAPWIVAVAGALLLAAVGSGAFLLFGRGRPEARPGTPAQPAPAPPAAAAATTPSARPTSVAPTEPAPDSRPSAAAAPLKLAVNSEPAGATLTLDGSRVGTTPAEIAVDPSRDHKLTAASAGYASQDVTLVAGRIPRSLDLTLEPAGPPGTLHVVSAYPVDVLWKGKLLAKGEVSPRVSLPPGRQTILVVSASHFVRREASLDVKSGAAVGLELPGLGKINIKANPDNCEVSIDGVFVDYPPILDKPIAEGSHTVGFKWPDGMKRDETVQVKRDSAAYVMGRRN